MEANADNQNESNIKDFSNCVSHFLSLFRKFKRFSNPSTFQLLILLIRFFLRLELGRGEIEEDTYKNKNQNCAFSRLKDHHIPTSCLNEVNIGKKLTVFFPEGADTTSFSSVQVFA